MTAANEEEIGMTKRQLPRRKRPVDPILSEWANKELNQQDLDRALQGFEETVHQTSEKLAAEMLTKAVLDQWGKVVLVPSLLQQEILQALDGQKLTGQKLIYEICGSHNKNILYRNGDIAELLKLKLIA
ncbi:MAG: hypothetical protein N2C14_06695, partial [Planctomycetales bacterium]